MQQTQEFFAELRRSFYGEIRFDPVTRALFSTDASIYQIVPLGVIWPKDQDALQCAVEIAAKHHLPILPRGSGSSLAGQAIGEAVIIDTSKYLNRILSIDPEEMSAVVEPGVILAALNKQAAKHNLQFGPDPASAERATIGGVLGNNATGAHSIQYGMTADHVQWVDAIHADGSQARWGEVALEIQKEGIFGNLSTLFKQFQLSGAADIKKSWPRTWRNSAGYRLNYLIPWSNSKPPQWDQGPYPREASPGMTNIAPLLAGSEGTLAVVRQAKLSLVKKPNQTILAILEYQSVVAACEDVPRLLQFQPSAVELIPQNLVQLAKSVPAYAKNNRFFNQTAGAFLAVEFAGEDADALINMGHLKANLVTVATSQQDQEAIWATRKVGLGLFDSGSSSARPIAFIEDCAIPVEELGLFVRQLENIFDQHHVQAAYYAHASAGCLHVRPIIDLRSDGGKDKLYSISRQVKQITLELGGSMSSEHGDGIVRGEWIRETVGDEAYAWMQKLKRVADPHNLLNPNKIIDTPSILSNFRNQDSQPIHLWSSKLDFSDTRTMLSAIEKCNGQGVCRKDTGVMCPSFQATREEVFSTRGRANLLREFVYAKNSPLKVDDLKQTFDLCLACKACKSECPSKVDVAKLKIAFYERYYRENRHSVRDYLFGYLPSIIGIFHHIPWIYNQSMSVLENTPMLMDRIGIRAKAGLPRISLPIKGTADVLRDDSAALKVILIADTYTRYFDPSVELSARKILASMGCLVITPAEVGTGRTLLSKGFLPAAQKHLAKLAAQIRSIDPDGTMPIIGLEPSEVSVLKDDILSILPGQQSQAIANRTWLLEEFMVRQRHLITAEPDAKGQVTLHTHCHQKSVPPSTDGYPVGSDATIELLRGLGYRVDFVNSGCCGMAGSFGYEKEHAEISQDIAEMSLFPALRSKNLQQGALICATGTSCRTQIGTGLGYTVLHPAELIWKAINR